MLNISISEVMSCNKWCSILSNCYIPFYILWVCGIVTSIRSKKVHMRWVSGVVNQSNKHRGDRCTCPMWNQKSGRWLDISTSYVIVFSLCWFITLSDMVTLLFWTHTMMFFLTITKEFYCLNLTNTLTRKHFISLSVIQIWYETYFWFRNIHIQRIPWFAKRTLPAFFFGGDGWCTFVFVSL